MHAGASCYSVSNAHAHTNAYTHTYTDTHTDAHTYTDTHTNACTHTDRGSLFRGDGSHCSPGFFPGGGRDAGPGSGIGTA